MRRFIITGAPGAGKTAIIRQLELDGLNLGFITPTEARRISFEETVRFEKIHEETYRDFGFELVSVEPRSLVERVSIIKAAIRADNSYPMLL